MNLGGLHEFIPEHLLLLIKIEILIHREEKTVLFLQQNVQGGLRDFFRDVS